MDLMNTDLTELTNQNQEINTLTNHSQDHREVTNHTSATIAMQPITMWLSIIMKTMSRNPSIKIITENLNSSTEDHLILSIILILMYLKEL